MLSRRVIALVLTGGAAIVLNWVLLFAAYPRASISVATTVYNTQPFMLIALGALVFREKITGPTFGWLALSFAGLVLVVEHQPAVLILRGKYLEGIGLAVGAAFLYTIASLIAKGLKGTSPHVIALLQVTLGVVLLAPFTDFHALPAGASQWGSLVTLGLVHTCLMYVLLYGAIQKLPTTMTGALSFIYPVVAIIVDHFALGQHLAWSQLAGAALILLAAAGVNQGWTLPLLRPRTGKPG
jgi:drug/metabolite transporter (DMT)-like permease